jgi:hypothetical protein
MSTYLSLMGHLNLNTGSGSEQILHVTREPKTLVAIGFDILKLKLKRALGHTLRSLNLIS